MNKLIIAIVLSVVSFSAQAEDWSFLAEQVNNGDRFYVDLTSIKQVGSYVRMRIKTNRGARNKNGTLSTVSLREFDCYEEKGRMLTLTAYSGHNLTGRNTKTEQGAGRWYSQTPGTVGGIELNAACNS